MKTTVSKKTKEKIRKMLAEGKVTRTEIAKQLGVSRGTVYEVGLSMDLEEKSEVECLQSEIELLRDELRTAKRGVKTTLKNQGIINSVVSMLPDRIEPLNPLPPVKKERPKGEMIEETLVLHLSDGHHDSVVTPEEVGGLETYNFDVSCRRAENYVDTVLEWTQEHLAGKFRFPRCVVLAYGDHTSGQIHEADKRSHFHNQFRNCLSIGELHSLMFRDLAPHFETINIVYVSGNHGRVTPKKDHHGAQENWDFLVAKVAEQLCRGLPNVSFTIPNAFSVNLDIEGHGFNISHGDDVKGQAGVPYYGVARRQKNLQALSPLMSGPRVRYACMGHFHSSTSIADFDGEILMNGAWIGTDQYSFNSFSGYREPVQLMHGVHRKHGVSWRMPVKLRSVDDVKGPQRYKVAQ